MSSGGQEQPAAGGAEDPQPRRFVGQKSAADAASGQAGPVVVKGAAAPRRVVRNVIPPEILENDALNRAISVLPRNYNFEVHKTVWRIQQSNAKRVALQFPEGLLLYSNVIADIVETFTQAEHVFVMGDVTYGACCVDDFSAEALGADILVHYGHSCLVPVNVTSVPCVYIFVEIKMDVGHLVASIRHNFKPGTKILIAGTIQFSSSIQAARRELEQDYPSVAIPQCKPLSPGEILGCTSPVVAGGAEALIFVADGRFHLESFMIANPSIPAYRYDPYNRKMTSESYDQAGMRGARRGAIEAARLAGRWAVVLGTLGRQGNPRVMETVTAALERAGKEYVEVLLSEVTPDKLRAFGDAFGAYVQIACPRLSIDWGEGFAAPTLTPYEALVALGEVPEWWGDDAPKDEATGLPQYPMDYYSREGGSWSSSYIRAADRPARRRPQAPPAQGCACAAGGESRAAPCR
ncbi:unnamed protein product [Pedinophyceae sp. YPF-701]|nr:unnamed protein product [Pedinophyceae sp. YPF-701]